MVVVSKGPSRGCYFCGATPRTKEHILPDWLDGVISGLRRNSLRKYEHHLPGESTFHVKTFGRSLLRQTVKETCGPCNNGWMSQLESQVQASIAALILAEPMILAPHHLYELLRWAVKTHMMRAQLDTMGFPFPQEHRDAIRRNHEIPDGWDFWLGPTKVDGFTHRNWSVTVDLDNGLPAMTFSQTTLALVRFTLTTTYVSDAGIREAFAVLMNERIKDLGAPVYAISQSAFHPIHSVPGLATAEQCHELSDTMRQVVNFLFDAQYPDIPYEDPTALPTPSNFRPRT